MDKNHIEDMKRNIEPDARAAYMKHMEKVHGVATLWDLGTNNEVFNPINMLAWTSLWIRNRNKLKKRGLVKIPEDFEVNIQRRLLTDLFNEMCEAEKIRQEMEEKARIAYLTLLRESNQYRQEPEWKIHHRYMGK